MQPIFLSFVSGVAYRKIVKRHFRSISTIDHLVSISNCSPKVAKLLFLTAGNKSYCGTLQRLTHPQQSTDSPILEPVSSSKRQASQRKPFALSSTPAQTSSRLRTHGTSVPAAPQKPPGALIRTTSAPPMRPSCAPLAPCRIHPPGYAPPPQSRMQFPNRSDSTTRSDINQQHTQGELHAKLPDTTATPPMRPPSALTLPPHPKVACNSSGTSFIDSSKTAEYQRSDFKT